MAAWIVVKRKMKSFQILDEDVSIESPRTCPNCGLEATVTLRYGYEGSISRTLGRLFGRATYFATFGYCQACSEQAVAAMTISNSFRWFLLLGLFVGACLFMGIQQVSTMEPEVCAGIGFGAGALMGMAAWWAFRRNKVRKHPLLGTQVAWGPAAYYAGTKFLGMREDWVRELVKLNPELFDDAVRAKWIGGPGT